jgi:hypothetical protein
MSRILKLTRGNKLINSLICNSKFPCNETELNALKDIYQTNDNLFETISQIHKFVIDNYNDMGPYVFKKIFNSTIFNILYVTSICALSSYVENNKMDEFMKLMALYSDMYLINILCGEFDTAIKLDKLANRFNNYEGFMISTLHNAIKNNTREYFNFMITYIKYAQSVEKLNCNCLKLVNLAKELLLFNKTDYIDIVCQNYPIFDSICQTMDKGLKTNICTKCDYEGTDIFVCSVCKITTYCGIKCQFADWNRHKIYCKPPIIIPNKIALKNCLYIDYNTSLYCMLSWECVDMLVN